jgi:hypothetical protein
MKNKEVTAPKIFPNAPGILLQRHYLYKIKFIRKYYIVYVSNHLTS